ncbi:MAG: hypothetical protein MJ188_06725 [Treponema sp.]|nr:hypothetical protein [Treponema sp.]
MNETIQFRIEYSSKNMDSDKIYAIPLIENVEIKVLEGTVIPTDMEDVIFIDFVRPDLEDKETETFLPYCNLELKFLKASIYDFRITGTYKPEFYYSLNAGRHIKFTVTE